MDIVSSNFLPGDPRLIDQIVYELKSQGIFDQFRKECFADVDTKPAYQNLSQRVEGSVMNFLNKQKFAEELNKNQLREQLRKNITESGFLDSGVERIVDQVVNPKINTIFLPKVEDVVYRFLGIARPNQENPRPEIKPIIKDLLPNDLEAVSPESVNDQSLNLSGEKKDDHVDETNDNSLNSSNNKTEDESPPFESLEEDTKFSVHEENSVDSQLSGVSGLASHDSIHSNDLQMSNQMEISQDISQNSINSEGNLSIITSEEDTKMEICEDTSMSEISNMLDITAQKNFEQIKENHQVELKIDVDNTPKVNLCDEITVEKTEDKVDDLNKINFELDVETQKAEEKKQGNIKSEPKKTHDNHKTSKSSKERKDDKDRRSRSKSESKSKDHKDKSSSKHNSSSKDKEKDKKSYTNGKEDILEKDKISKKEDKERNKNREKSSSRTKDGKEKSDKSRDRSEKPKDKTDKDRERSDKEKTSKEKDRSNKEKSVKDKDKLGKEKEKSETDKHKSSKDKDKSDKNKSEKNKSDRDRSSSSKQTKDNSSSSSKKDGKEKDKYEDKSKDKSSSSKDKASSNNKHKESSSKEKDVETSKSFKDKERSKSSSSTSKDKDKRGSDSKSKSSDKYQKSDRDKSSLDKSSLSSRKDKEKKVTDDHYSLKDKKSDRRSTDRDSNDGSSKMSRNSSFTETYSNSYKGSSKESSEVFSSGGGDSSNSEKIEEKLTEDSKDAGSVDLSYIEATPPIKYNKPKFASNIHEAMKIMKIRKQLAKLERQNQLALVQVPKAADNTVEMEIQQTIMATNQTDKSPGIENSLIKEEQSNTEKGTIIEMNPETFDQISPKELKSPPKHNGKEFVELQVRLERHIEAKTFVSEEMPVLKSRDLSMESFEALEARLAQEMSNVNVNIYGEEDDYYEYSSITITPFKKQKTLDEQKITDQCTLEKYNKAVNKKEERFTFGSSRVPLEPTQTNSEAHEPSPETSTGRNWPKKIVYSDFNEYINNEIELVAREQSVVPSNEIIEMSSTNDDFIVDRSKDDIQMAIDEQVVTEETIIVNDGTNPNSIECIDMTIYEDQEDILVYIQDDVIEDNPQICTEEILECSQTDVSEDIAKQCSDETKLVQEAAGHLNATGAEELFNDLDETNGKFRGFTIFEKDTFVLTNIRKLIDKLSHDINALREKSHLEAHVTTERNASESPEEDLQNIILKPESEQYITSSSKKVEIKERRLASIQDLLQTNGKKLFIKIDKLKIKLTPKVLVTLQDMDLNEVVKNKIGDSSAVIGDVTNVPFNGKTGKAKTLFHGQDEDTKHCHVTKEQLSIINREVITAPCEINNEYITWEDEDSPCYYFDKNNTLSETHLIILNKTIGRLEKAIEAQSLKMQNNIPKPKKRGRKRKIHGTENNNSLVCDFKPERKRRLLSDANSNQNGDNLCNTDVSSQGFSLPLSPADSDKSVDHKKEEPVTVKTKRTGRGSSTKRYSSEDLYKPRPILNWSTSRRRCGRGDDSRSSI